MIATSFALVSFATAVVVGLYARNDLPTVVGRAVVILFGCYLVGLVIGRVAQWAVDDHIDQYRKQHPVPQEPGEADSPASEPRAAA